jgi:hypothetical protein
LASATQSSLPVIFDTNMSSVSNTTITSHSADRSGGAGRTSTPAGNTGAGSTGAPNNRDGRNRRRNKQNRSEDNSAGNNGAGNNGDATKPKATFKGDEPGMNGHVFGCYDEQTNKRQYLLTMSALKQFTMKTYKFAHDLESLFRPTPSNPVIPRPTKPVARAGATVDEVDMLIFNERIKEHVTRLSRLDSNLAAIWSVTYGQCTRAMRDKLDAIPEFEDKYKDKDCLWLFASIRGINMKFDQTRYAHLALLEAFQGLLTIKQTPGQTVNDYSRDLLSASETIEHYGGSIVLNPNLASEKDPTGKKRTPDQRAAATKAELLALLLLRGSDQSRYGSLVGHLANQYANGRDEYPKDLATATSLLIHYSTPMDRRPNKPKDKESAPKPDPNRADAATPTVSPAPPPAAITFAHANGSVDAASPPVTTGAVTVAASLLQSVVMMTQSNSLDIDPWSILLDSQSTISVFNNAALLSNIRATSQPIRAITNGGHQDSHLVGDFPNLGPVYFNPDSIANILSLAAVAKVCRVTMDSSASPSLDVHRLNGTIMRFSQQPSGLFVYTHKPTNTPVDAYTLVNTVADNKQLYTKRQLAQADDARRLYRLLGRPDDKVFLSLLRDNYLLNCPLTVEDATRATHIYGPDVPTLKGKTTRTTAAAHVPSFHPCALPDGFLDAHQRVTICVDFFFVQEVCFLHTISRDIQFRTVSPVPDRHRATIRSELSAVCSIYAARGFRVTNVHCDSEFECVQHDFPDIHFAFVAADGHVGEVERSIRTIKERVRAVLHSLPFRRVPILLIRRAVVDVNRLLNLFPSASGASTALSPAAIVTGAGRPDYKFFTLEFGSYVQVFDDFSPTNTPRARTMGALALDPCHNTRGAYNFLSLSTGALISRHRWECLPISDTVIARVEALAFEDGQPLIQSRNFVAEPNPDYPIDESEYDLPYHPTAKATARASHASAHTLSPSDFDPIDDSELSDLAGPFSAPPIPAAQGAIIPDDITDDIADIINTADTGAQHEDQEASEDDQGAQTPEENQGASQYDAEADEENDSEDQGALVSANTSINGATTHRTYNLRSRSSQGSANFNSAMDAPFDGKSYYPPRVNHLQSFQYMPPKSVPAYTLLHGNTDLLNKCFDKVSSADCKTKFAVNFVLAHIKQSMDADAGIKKTQMSFKEGLKRYGKEAEAALMKEFAQLEDLNVYEAVNARLLTKEQRRGALRAINLIKEKRTGQIKGRTVADGSVQRSLYDKADTASPTIATDALMLSIIVDAYEGRDVATADIAGAYLKAYMKDFVLMKFSGPTVKVLCELNPKHKPFVVLENGQEVIYVRLIKALYGCVKSALLWYELFSTTLESMGFELNPYDRCIANCTIDGKQCTIGWYVDDTKISHEDPAVVTRVIDTLESHFGKMTVQRGDEHVFLGMQIKYDRVLKTANVSMREYLTEAISESGLAIVKAASTPASKDLFSVSAASPFLSKSEQEVFHSVVAKLLYVSIRARMDLLLTTSFLATRVSKSTQQDLDKLKRLLEYILGSLDDNLIVGADRLGRFRTWVDASYAVHPDFRSHTGGAISFGRGTIACKSTKQKLNTKSSTEAETVGASDYLPNTIWVKMFMEAQGYVIDECVLEQDNQSAIKLATNGRASAGPKSRHIDIRYFWLKDRVRSGEIRIRHCPTHQMLADFFTKPLQGYLFHRFKAVVLGHQHTDSLQSIIAHSLEERVGEEEEQSNSDNDNYLEELAESELDVSEPELEVRKKVKFSSATYAEVVKGHKRRNNTEPTANTRFMKQ